MTNNPQSDDAFVNAVNEAGRIFVESNKGGTTRMVIGYGLDIDARRWADEHGTNIAVARKQIKEQAEQVARDHFANLGY